MKKMLKKQQLTTFHNKCDLPKTLNIVRAVIEILPTSELKQLTSRCSKIENEKIIKLRVYTII